jgi:hypothetical protein
MAGRYARDDEVAAWKRDGWVLVDELLDAAEIDAAAEELWQVFPTGAAYHADPEGETEKRLGRPAPPNETFTWPETGPGFRPEQHRWRAEFPFPGPHLNRLTVHPAILDFMERALETTEVRCYQAQCTAKYAGITNYEQPLHTDRNHSWLPPRPETEWQHVESFLYLSDVDDGSAPTHVVNRADTEGYSPNVPLLWPTKDPEVYAVEHAAAGPRGSLLVYRTDVWHRGVDMTSRDAARFLMNVSYKAAHQEWIGFHAFQSRASSPHWTEFVEGSTPRELAVFGFPPPGHPIWTPEFLDATQERYPKLELGPWRDQISESASSATRAG